MRRSKLLFASALILAAIVSVLGCQSDSFTTVDLSGRATYPPGVRALGEVAPAANANFQVVDLARRAGEDVVAFGQTSDQGGYSVTVPVTTSVAVIVFGEVRVSGIIDPRFGSVEKSFDGITDLACEAGVTAVRDGSITAEQMDEERVRILEEAAAVVAAESTIDYSNADGSRAAAAKRIRVLTDNGDHPINDPINE